ncbi:MAG: hypothetical protein V4599_02505 [Verrucomicrobiota bacterium]
MKYIICLFAGAVALGAYFWLAPSSAAKAASTVKLKPTEPLKVDAGVDLGKLSEAECKKIVDHFKGAKHNDLPDFTAVASPGETIISQAYENGSGSYTFYSFVPTIEYANGQPIVSMEINFMTAGINGEQSKGTRQVVALKPGAALNRTLITEGGFYDVDITADVDDSSQLINLRVASKYTPSGR